MKRDLRFSILDLRTPGASIQNLKSKIQNPWLLLIVLIGIALRLWLIHVSPLDPRFSNADDGDYYRRALRFAVTGQYLDDAWLIRPPLHVLFFAGWLRLAFSLGRPQLGLLLIQLAQTAISALTVALGYGVARRLFASARAGLLFAAFLALWYPFVEQPTVLFSELLYLFLFLLHVWLLLRFDASDRRRDLALSGLALGAAALTRSPALYSLAFVVLWLVLRAWRTKNKEQRTDDQQSTAPALFSVWRTKNKEQRTDDQRSTAPALFSVLCSLFVVVACCLAVVGPWTLRNYLVYQRVIPVDTLGPINLWLDLDDVSRRNQHIDELRRLPQADRQAYATARVREILAEDPLRPFRSMWPTFRHIWKAQYVEDFFVKQSFFTRPLRESAPLGLPGDLIWLVYTLGGLIALAAPPREGLHNRLFVLAWLGYSLLTVLVFHVEPRYLLPIWTLIGLYGAWALACPRALLAGFRVRLLNGALAAALGLAFVVLLVTYRDYPAIISAGVARERAIVAGEQAYAHGDYADAERAFRAALAVQPDFVDGQTDLALALAAQGRRDEALALVQGGGSRRTELVAGVLERQAGDSADARDTLARIEATAGEEIQRWAREWLRPPPTSTLVLGDGRDLGYITGFSGPESGPAGSFRWLEGSGSITLPLPEGLRPGATLVLRMSGGRPDATPLEVQVGDARPQHILIQGGQWRSYRLPLTAAQAGQRALTIALRAPTFIPASSNPGSDDLRSLSVMIGDVRLEYFSSHG